MAEKVYIDATGLILGRLSSAIVPMIMGGKEVVVVNAEKAVVTGNRRFILNKYLTLRRRRTLTNPRRGPFFPRFPDRIVRRTVRGMLPYKTTSGREAFRRLSAYIGVPEELEGKEFTTIEQAKLRETARKFMTLEEIGREIGWTHDR
ncbi:MAG: 50S ribosomal protein L13 [Methanobacteriota archaeon]|nr:MAG: 50S ribosomal protein L13 [Euryarchaeota archaeon]